MSYFATYCVAAVLVLWLLCTSRLEGLVPDVLKVLYQRLARWSWHKYYDLWWHPSLVELSLLWHDFHYPITRHLTMRKLYFGTLAAIMIYTPAKHFWERSGGAGLESVDLFGNDCPPSIDSWTWFSSSKVVATSTTTMTSTSTTTSAITKTMLKATSIFSKPSSIPGTRSSLALRLSPIADRSGSCSGDTKVTWPTSSARDTQPSTTLLGMAEVLSAIRNVSIDSDRRAVGDMAEGWSLCQVCGQSHCCEFDAYRT